MKSMSLMRRDERGMASILVTMIMIIVISLIVLGFAQVARRNQREALDSQLSAQAYYAAESGVNAAVNYLSANPGYNSNTTGNCSQFITGPLAGGNVLSSATKTEYSCLMVNPEPTSLNLSPLTQSSNMVMHIKNADGQPITKLQLQWAEQATPTFPTSNPANNCQAADGAALPAYAAWNCPFGLVRLDLVPGNNSSVTSTNLENDETVTSFYLIPSLNKVGSPYTQSIGMSSSPGWQPVNPASSPNAACDGNPSDPISPATDQTCPVRVVHVQCSTGAGCILKLDITGGQSEYYARMSMMYQDTSSLTITGADSVTPLGQVKFIDGQVVIDSTGQSQDELRRVQVRVPLLSAQGTTPSYDLQSTDSICKRLTITNTASGSSATDNCTDR